MSAGTENNSAQADAMPPRVTVRQLRGKQLHISSRGHAVLTDRPLDEGGSDEGCTSGELLLMAIGACATGSVRNYLQERGTACHDLRAEVFFEPAAKAGARERIVVAIEVGVEAARFDDETLARAATEGGVTSRVKLGSELEARITRAAATVDA